MFRLTILIAVAMTLLCCTEANSQKAKFASPDSKEFKEYWYSGKAELSRYELEQARYGEIHKGDAVLIFVTEDFDTKDQVKYEQGDKRNVESVLKLNFTRKFFTGIYPYSIMTSIFSPINYKKSAIKLSFSSQEWCGHTYAQMNLKDKIYNGFYHSYFQSEGDKEFSLDAVLLEDEIWTKIRLNPSALPTGNIKVIPSTTFLRLKHIEYTIADAIAKIEPTVDASLSGKSLNKYSLEYPDLARSLVITFESTFPYAIVSWEETYKSGFGDEAKLLTTRAKRTHTINSAYWSQHNVADADLRKELGLNMGNY